MRFFLRKAAGDREPLAVTMTGVRMGERVLQIGVADERLTAQLAAKPGISGHAAIVVRDENAGDRARAAALEAGALVDVHVAATDALPFDDRAFDVVIVHGAAGQVAALDPATRASMLTESLRVLRPGGRLVALEPGTPTGLASLIRRPAAPDSHYEAAGGTPAALEAAGFKPVRLLADREGTRFIEGLKT